MFTSDGTLNPLTYEEIAEVTSTDEMLCRVKIAIKTDKWSEDLKRFHAVKRELYLIGDTIVFRDKYVVPVSLREKALRIAHRGHLGMSSMKRSMRRSLWWPYVNKDIEQKVSSCITCLKISRPAQPIPLSSRTLPDEPMEIVQIDFLYIPRCGTEEFLMVTDTFSRMFWIIEMKRTNAASTNGALHEIFNVWGRSRIMFSDNGPPFNSPAFTESWKGEGVLHKRVIPYCPQMNGMVERRNQGVLKALRAAEVEGVGWRRALSEYVNAYNHDVPHSVTNATPFELSTGRRYRGFFPSMVGMQSAPLSRDDIIERDSAAKLKSTQYADNRRGAKESDIKEGDWVVVANRHRSDKMDVTFLKDHFQVLCRVGAKVIVRNAHGVEYTRWVSDVKRVPDRNWMELSPGEQDEANGNSFDEEGTDQSVTNKQVTDQQVRPQRNRCPPKKLEDYVRCVSDQQQVNYAELYNVIN